MRLPLAAGRKGAARLSPQLNERDPLGQNGLIRDDPASTTFSPGD